MGRPCNDDAADWTIMPLGIEPDWKVAERLGVTRQAVAWQRRRRGIAPSQQPPRGKSDLLHNVVLRVLARHHYPISATQVWMETREDYGEVSLRSVQRVLAKIRSVR